MQEQEKNETDSTDNSLQEVLQEVSSTMPEISPHVVQLQQELKTEEKPAIAQDEKKKRGRPKKDKSATHPTMENRPKQGAASRVGLDQPPQEDPKLKTAVNVACQLTQASGIFIAGVDGRFNDSEGVIVASAYEEYFKAKGAPDIPPGLALAMGLTAYYGRIVTMPQAKSKMSIAGAWLKTKVKSLFSFKVKNAAQSDTRDDNVRENDASQKAAA